MIVNAQRDCSRCEKTPSFGEALRRYSSLEHGLTSENILFSHQVVNNWNDLLEWVVSVDSVALFESSLDQYWRNQKQKFKHRAHITTTRSRNRDSNEAAVLEPQAH